MNCLKCGTKTTGNQVFCDDCLQVMEKYPVKQDTAVQLPQREPRNVEKKQPRKKESAAVRLSKQKNAIIIWLMLTVLVLCGVVGLLTWKLLQFYGGSFPFF